MMPLEFRVYGDPVPQGSTRAFVVKGKPVITSTARGLGAWRNAIASAVVGRTVPVGGAFDVDLVFILARPKSLPKKVTRPVVHKNDIDKLARAALDALTHIVWDDDGQVVTLMAEKRYATPECPPGLIGTVSVVEETPEAPR